MHRTIQLSLAVTAEQAVSLLETSRQFTEAFNAVCRTGWDADEKNGVKLHHLTYRWLKDRFPDLVSDLHCQARVKATEAIRSAFIRRKQGMKTGCPHSVSCPPRYERHTMKVDWTRNVVRLSTVAGRMDVSFSMPDVFAWVVNGKICSADLIHRDGRFWLYVSVELPTPVVEPNSTVIGVDLGLNRPAVISSNKFLGERRWKAVEARLFRQKRQCQSKRSKSSKRRLRILSGRQARFRRDCDHVLSRQIIDATPAGATVVLENLTDIKKRVKRKQGKQRRRLHGWSFAQLRAFVTYKAEMKGVRVVAVDPRHTSQTCSKCGHQHRSNRRSQSLFKCRQCGFTLNADLNAARNVRDKHLISLGIPLADRPLSTGPTG